jgi:hypothetical protein
MRPFSKFTLFILCISLIPHTLYSQDSLQYRKLYLHTDREQYFLGDTLWYKGYYLEGKSNKFIPGIITIYTDLIDEHGNSVVEQIVALDNGAAPGAIFIPDTLEPGNYMLRAFTDFQRLIGEEAFFYKQVKIFKLESFVEKEPPELPPPEEIYLDFLPEGGMLLEGYKNIIALKAMDSLGNGIPVEGDILDSQGTSVAFFHTSYKGMGSFAFTPMEGESYTARTATFPDFHYRFRDIVKEGIKIGLKEEDRENLHFQVVTNASSFVGRPYYFAISHHGDVIFYQKFVPKNSVFPITVNRDALRAGINKMVLLDEQLVPISERLYFSSNLRVNEIKIKPDKQAYETRSQVRLRLSDGKEMGEGSWSNLSMAVVDEFATGKEGPSMNILSYLLINSELKGTIESPLDYFSDDQELTSAAKLDLLMMTQGWSRYVWDHPEEYLAGNGKDKQGFDLSGEVHKVIGNNPVDEGSVELKVYNNNFMYMNDTALNEDGKFVFRDVSFMDTASVFVQAKNNRGKLAYEVSLEPIFNQFPGTSADYYTVEVSYEYKQAGLFQKQYDNLQALKEYTLKSGGIYLDEVTITEQKREPDDGHFRIYSRPSNSLQVTERDVTYRNVFDYMQGRFAGVKVAKDFSISIRGGGSFGPCSPLLLLDGFPVDREVFLSIPMNDIDRVEVLKNPAETAIFGTRGGCGVVSVFTKKGGTQDYSDKYIPGTIAEKLEGYAPYREFYSLVYTRENINSERPDHRIVLFWEPSLFTENGKATVSFFTSDDISRYKVYVEGITRDGEVCLGTASFEVDQKK